MPASHIREHSELLQFIDAEVLSTIENIAEVISACFINGGKLYICGSSLSALVARYATVVFATKCNMERPPLPAQLLTGDVFFLSPSETALDIYEKQVNTLLNEQDVLLGIVNDDTSEDIIRAMRAAAHSNIKTIALAGINNTNVQGVSDLLLHVPSKNPVLILEMHMILIHLICDTIDHLMFSPEE